VQVDMKNDDDWLQNAVTDADEALAEDEAHNRNRRTATTARAEHAAFNADRHADAVRRVRAVIALTHRTLAEHGNPGKERLFRLRGLFGRTGWGWRVEMPTPKTRFTPGEPPPLNRATPVLYLTVPADGPSFGQEARGEVVGLPDALWLLDTGDFATRVGAAVDERDLFDVEQLIDLILPTQVPVLRPENDRHSQFEVVDLFPLVDVRLYAAHTESIARRLAAGLITILKRQRLPVP
jgi:hypothetical protein